MDKYTLNQDEASGASGEDYRLFQDLKRATPPEKPTFNQAQMTFLENYRTGPNKFHIGKSCEAAGVVRSSFNFWMATNPVFNAIVTDIRETIVDTAETGLHKAAASGEAWAIKFILERLGKKRGYGLNLDITSGNKPIQINILPADGNQPQGD